MSSPPKYRPLQLDTVWLDDPAPMTPAAGLVSHGLAARAPAPAHSFDRAVSDGVRQKVQHVSGALGQGAQFTHRAGIYRMTNQTPGRQSFRGAHLTTTLVPIPVYGPYQALISAVGDPLVARQLGESLACAGLIDRDANFHLVNLALDAPVATTLGLGDIDKLTQLLAADVISGDRGARGEAFLLDIAAGLQPHGAGEHCLSLFLGVAVLGHDEGADAVMAEPYDAIEGGAAEKCHWLTEAYGLVARPAATFERSRQLAAELCAKCEFFAFHPGRVDQNHPIYEVVEEDAALIIRALDRRRLVAHVAIPRTLIAGSVPAFLVWLQSWLPVGTVSLDDSTPPVNLLHH